MFSTVLLAPPCSCQHRWMLVARAPASSTSTSDRSSMGGRDSAGPPRALEGLGRMWLVAL